MTIPSIRKPVHPSALTSSTATSDAKPTHHTAIRGPANVARRLDVLRWASPYPSCALAAVLCLLGAGENSRAAPLYSTGLIDVSCIASTVSCSPTLSQGSLISTGSGSISSGGAQASINVVAQVGTLAAAGTAFADKTGIQAGCFASGGFTDTLTATGPVGAVDTYLFSIQPDPQFTANDNSNALIRTELSAVTSAGAVGSIDATYSIAPPQTIPTPTITPFLISAVTGQVITVTGQLTIEGTANYYCLAAGGPCFAGDVSASDPMKVYVVPETAGAGILAASGVIYPSVLPTVPEPGIPVLIGTGMLLLATALRRRVR